jgi:hypothetical protein
VVYKSSLNEGFNIAFFEEKYVAGEDKVDVYKITSTKYTFELL